MNHIDDEEDWNCIQMISHDDWSIFLGNIFDFSFISEHMDMIILPD